MSMNARSRRCFFIDSTSSNAVATFISSVICAAALLMGTPADAAGDAGAVTFATPSTEAQVNNAVGCVEVDRVGGDSGNVSATYSTFDNDATAGHDYAATSGTLSWSDGDPSLRVIEIPVAASGVGHSFSVVLLSSLGAQLGSVVNTSVYVAGNPQPNGATIQFVPAVYAVPAGVTTAIATVRRVGTTSDPVVVSYTTRDGTAAAGVDYASVTGSLSWAAGDASSKTIQVALSPNAAAGGTFHLTLMSVTGAILGSPMDATIAIGATSAALVPGHTDAWCVKQVTASGTPTPPSGTPTPPSGAPTPPPVTQTAGPGIKVKGNSFVSTQDGSRVQLIGTQVSGLETGYPQRWPQFSNAGVPFWQSLINYQGSGLNTVRFPLNEASWLNYNCYDMGTGASAKWYSAVGGGAYKPDPSNVYQATVEKAVADATAAGLYVILVDSVGAPNNSSGQPLCPIGQPGFANADHSLAFWKSVADTFKNNPAVIFELFNEPFGNNQYNAWVIQTGSSTFTPGTDGNTLLNGGPYYPLTTQDNTNNNAWFAVNETWQVAGMQQMLDTVRGEGATNVVLSAPIGWAGEIETWLATRPSDSIGQLGVAWHLYGYNKGTAPPTAVLAAGFPIAVTETFGFDAAVDGGSNANGYSWAQLNGIGYTWCCWNDWGMQSSLATAFSQEGPPWYRAPAP